MSIEPKAISPGLVTLVPSSEYELLEMISEETADAILLDPSIFPVTLEELKYE